MKKLFLAIIFSAVLFFGLPQTNVSAMSVTYDIPFSAVPDIADMFMGMLSGAKYDLSGVSTLEEVVEQHKSSLQQGYHFLQSFATKLWNWQVTQAGLGNDSLTQDTDLPIYISISDLANYMGYNIKWYERDQTVETIETFTPADYLTKVDKATHFYYTFSNVQYDLLSLNLWSTSNSWDVWNNRNDYSYVKSQNNQYFCAVNKVNFNLIGSDSTWSLTVDSTITGNYNVFGNKPPYSTEVSYYRSMNPYTINDNILRLGFASNLITSSNITFPKSFNSINAALDWINSNYYCVNFSVNGVLWGYSGEAPTDYITAPDVYGVGDLGIDIYDVFFPKTEDYGGFSINGFLEWLQGQIGNKDVGLDDLIEDAPDIIITVDENNEPTTRPITYDDTRPVPIVIDGDIPADPDPDNPTPTPSPDPTNFPLPPFPKFPIPSDIPNTNIQHTVLAEIVDATQTVVPQDLMVLIWATFSLLIVGGIIYILHK